jgi:hypothetical protein
MTIDDRCWMIRDGAALLPPFIKTAHFERRQAQRKVSDAAIALALRCGDVFFQGEDRVYFLGRKHLPPSVRDADVRHLDGTTVVLGPENVLVTTFRNPAARRALKRRSNGVKNQTRN